MFLALFAFVEELRMNSLTTAAHKLSCIEHNNFPESLLIIFVNLAISRSDFSVKLKD